MANILQELEQRIVIGNGAIGTYLYALGIPRGFCLEALNLTRPDLVTKVYQDYVAAGARVLETNSSGANPIGLSRYGLSDQAVQLCHKAVELVRKVVEGKPCFIAGTTGPIVLRSTEPPISVEERREAYRVQIAALWEAGCDLLLLKTFTDLADLLLAIRTAKELGVHPIWASVAPTEEGRLSSGEDVGEALASLRQAGASIVGVNGACGVQATLHLLEQLELEASDLVSAFPNAGKPEFYEGQLFYGASPQYFASYLPRFVAEGARLIGGDYGTDPSHIAAMVAVAGSLRPVGAKPRRRRVFLREPTEEGPSRGFSWREESLLERLKRKTVSIVELDSPKTLAMERFLEGVSALEEAGADAISLADNSLAILRVSNVAAAVCVRQRSSLIPVLHIACRDRNLLGLQSELMGLGVLGFRHVLALTGDPAKAGDHPGATSVYDLNSVGLIRLLAGLNRGVNAVGKDLKGKTDFVIGCAFNPNARQIESQRRKLESKLQAGAQFVMTQPVFDTRLVKETARMLGPLGVPVFIGVLPLLSYRNAEFLHNEVPGIVIPEAVRERLLFLEGPRAMEAGLALAVEIAREILSHFRGIYIITPLLRYELSVRLLGQLGLSPGEMRVAKEKGKGAV
ncbi:bifunctional homocysteine S-methyltransferase/methylenetetrahydrofolate reductase [Candidatus Methylacidithermus pantelleriae]|uniref:5,10-methylenetetrahydrofolate reductase / Homolog of homocysteine-binding domain n=1 Tax=Candidatus Methylacidithermus pantelleriae TaxID=2744239 RepID=A0A8J2BVR8_9BACT|nr:bifunctional homocysteine S-methyltransferase/methylenetetrahydrofolate reductase [Candidatus Methylacidithermus pantelleriae]CAF0704591.1 5,10-methylenetetrahydrofolate reductase / Homolog of homocysteine-binding domain [Candidatus Methylacidithermus pantelleriae]